MAYEANMTRVGTFVAGEDLSAYQYKAVMLSTAANNTVLKPSGQGARCIGILQNAPVLGMQADVCIHGVSRGYGGDTTARGNPVTANGTDGEIGAAASGDYVLGMAVESLTDGGLHTILVAPTWVPLA